MLLQHHISRVCHKKHKSCVKTAAFTAFFESLWSPTTAATQKAGMSYVYDEDGALIADTLVGGASTTWGQSAKYIYLPTASGPMPVAAIYGTKHYAIQSDHLNTPRRLIQSDGQVAWQWAYSAFGDEQPTIASNRFANTSLNQSFGTTTVAAVTFNLRYPGQYYDQESGLHYNYHRSYSATIGRYTQSDPIGLDGGWNRFGYVGQNPLSYTDPKGLDYWMEGSVSGEGGHPFHQSVCVRKYSGGRLCISFGVAEDQCTQDCKGEVYEDTSAAGPLVLGRFRSTSAIQDSEIRAYFQSLIKKEGRYYLIGNNCRDFSMRVYWTLEQRYFPKGATPF